MCDKKRLIVDDLGTAICPSCEEYGYVFTGTTEDYDYYCEYCKTNFTLYDDGSFDCDNIADID